MKKELLLALIESFIDDKFNQIDIVAPKRGAKGHKGLDGKDFDFEEHRERISSDIKAYIDTLDLHGNDGRSGRDGKAGVDGISFSWDENRFEIEELFEKHKATFRGKRGYKGPKGQDFDFDKNKDKIAQLLPKKEDIKLEFEDLTQEDKDSLKIKGPRGQRGKGFVFEDHKDEVNTTLQNFFNSEKESFKLHFKDLSQEEQESLKLQFDDLTKLDKESLKIKGPRGQRGKSVKGDKGTSFLSGKGKPTQEAIDEDLYFDETTANIYKYIDGHWKLKTNIKGNDGLTIQGPIGQPGIAGENAISKDGVDGLDAPKIVDVEVKKSGKRIYFIFFFDNGTSIETDYISLPEAQSYFSSMMSTGGSGGSGTTLIVQKDGTDVGETTYLNFSGPNYTVTYDPITDTSTITNTSGLLTILDDGAVESTSVNKIDFVGDGVEVDNTTYISDWSDLSSIPEMTYTDDGYVRVIINKSDAEYLVATKTCSENISQHRFVSAISSTHVALGQSNDSSKSIVFGISLEAGLSGEDIRVLMFGNITDSIFSGISLNDPFFLALNGLISSAIPISGYIVRLGTSNGDNSGFIKIEEPIEI